MKYKSKILFLCLIIYTIALVFYYNINYLNYCKKNDSEIHTQNLKNRIKELENRLFRPRPKIFCIVLSNRNNLDHKAKIIDQSWAHLCDNRKFVSLFPEGIIKDKLTTEISYQNLTILQPPGMIDDKYEKLTDKIYATLKYVNDKYNNYDWYLKADDDSFIFVNNLRKFLHDKDPYNPVTYGYDFHVIVEYGYHSGGGSYVLSNNALKRISQKLNEDYKFCPNTGTEDVDVAKCLRKLNVYPERSFDELGRERFHPLNMWDHYQGNFPDWMFNYARNPVKKGEECCSDSSISFHYVPGSDMIKVKNILAKDTNGTITFKQIMEKMKLNE